MSCTSPPGLNLLSNTFGKLSDRSELQSEEGGLFFEVLAVAGGAGWSGLEGGGFVIGSLVEDHGVEDAGQFVRAGRHPLGFAQASFEPAAELSLSRFCGQCLGMQDTGCLVVGVLEVHR